MNIGDNLWLFDEVYREYRKDASGKAVGGPIFEKHFRPHRIVAATKQSWIAMAWHHAPRYPTMSRDQREVFSSKVRKSDLTSIGGMYGRMRWYTTDGMTERLWVNEFKPKIIRAVETCTTRQLKLIGEIVGIGNEPDHVEITRKEAV